MQLFYFNRQDRINNFGDSLNPWLWEKFISQELDNDETTAFVGIGTILNGLLPRRLPKALNFVIFSSGVGYGKGTVPEIDHRWKIYCVRGPLSAQKMGLPANLAIADGALLIKRIFQATQPKDCQFSFMPHLEHAITAESMWLDICAQTGIRYIDPRWPIAEILSLISKTEILLAEAMHGAIAAEALRVPWIPIRTSSNILSFKWIDWCTSIGLEYKPAEIITDANIAEDQIKLIANQLVAITQTVKPNMSKDEQIESLITQLEERLDQFKKDVKAGYFT